MERLQKVIASTGYCSRRKAEELILNGKVSVNGKKIIELGTKVEHSDIISINGIMLKREEKEYIILNKPRGVVTTTSDEHNRKTVMDLIETDKRLYPVGRLDYDTTGILLLTNDGELANLLMHPKNKIDKVYIAKVRGFLPKEEQSKLARGVVIDGIKTAPAKIRVRKYDKKTNTSIVEVTIHEGRNHQVKNMFSAIGHDTLKLKRERIAFLDLSNLKSGEYRYLNAKEVKKLYSEVSSK